MASLAFREAVIILMKIIFPLYIRLLKNPTTV